MSTIKNILNQSISRLKSSRSKTSSLDAEILLSQVLKKPKEFLYSHPEHQLTKSQISNIQYLISRRAKGEPLAYLTNHQKFFGLDFYVNKHVLIPRPETEILVESVIKQISNSKYQIANIADIGTGSGCIATTLAKNNPKLKIYATDICKRAIQVAQKNATTHKITKQIIFKHGNLLEPLKNIKIDVIVANLPYLTRQEYTTEPSIQFEPKKALIAKENGLEYFQKLFNQMNKFKIYPKFIFLEIGDKQAKDLKKLVSLGFKPQTNFQYQTQIKKDLAGRERALILKI